MYNAINPININYRKPQTQYQPKASEQTSEQSAQQQLGNALDSNRRFPNGREVAIDYSKGKVNIAQIVTDFNSTVLAINAPEDIQEEVGIYLKLVSKESEKPKPSKDIIFSNLKNAAKLSDRFIAQSLNKPSKVVEGWVDALFLQNIDLKSDPTHVNPDFKVQLPEKVPQAQVATVEPKAPPAVEEIKIAQEVKPEPPKAPESFNIFQRQKPEPAIAIAPKVETPVEVLGSGVEEISTPTEAPVEAPKLAAIERATVDPREMELKKIFSNAKKLEDPMGALQAFGSAIELAQETGNTKAIAAAHFERGKIFDKSDKISNALNEYNQALGVDSNLNAKAHIKMAEIYDDFAKFEPALNHYFQAVAFAGEANNLAGQSKALGGIATMYAQRYDTENTLAFNGLTVETALGTESPKVIGRAYSTVAKNYEYINESDKSLDSYKKAVIAFGRTEESYEQISKNYLGAAEVMEKLGNQAKADSLRSKAQLYQQKAQLG